MATDTGSIPTPILMEMFRKVQMRFRRQDAALKATALELEALENLLAKEKVK